MDKALSGELSCERTGLINIVVLTCYTGTVNGSGRSGNIQDSLFRNMLVTFLFVSLSDYLQPRHLRKREIAGILPFHM